MQETDSLGLKLDTTPPLDHPPSLVLYGPPGAGKSREMCLAFPRCLYIQTAPTVLQPVESFISWMKRKETTDKMIEAAGYDPALRFELELPNKITVPKYVPGTQEPLDPRPILAKITDRYLQASMAGTNEYEGLIFDEWSEMAHRIQQGIEKDPSFGRDGFKRSNALRELHYQLAEVPRATKTVLGLVCHEIEPQYDTNEGSPMQGQMVARGGPKMPIKRLTQEMSAAMDIALRIVVERGSMGGPSKRQYVTELQPDWICKIRAWGLKPREPLGLRGLLQRSGYKLS